MKFQSFVHFPEKIKKKMFSDFLLVVFIFSFKTLLLERGLMLHYIYTLIIFKHVNFGNKKNILILKFHPGMKCLHVFFSFFHPGMKFHLGKNV